MPDARDTLVPVTGIQVTVVVAQVNVWGPISTTQTPTWIVVTNPQTPSWGVIQTS